jgi:hypothetical protein
MCSVLIQRGVRPRAAAYCASAAAVAAQLSQFPKTPRIGTPSANAQP